MCMRPLTIYVLVAPSKTPRTCRTWVEALLVISSTVRAGKWTAQLAHDARAVDVKWRLRCGKKVEESLPFLVSSVYLWRGSYILFWARHGASFLVPLKLHVTCGITCRFHLVPSPKDSRPHPTMKIGLRMADVFSGGFVGDSYDLLYQWVLVSEGGDTWVACGCTKPCLSSMFVWRCLVVHPPTSKSI